MSGNSPAAGLHEESRKGEAFCTTRWTLVRDARGDTSDAREALGELCTAYYDPVHAYIAHTAVDLGDARDLSHEFFARLLAGSFIDGADAKRGRFRAYMLGAVKHFLADVRDKRSAAKRGAEYEHSSLADAGADSPAFEVPAANVSMEATFDREWGRTVLDRALGLLSEEHQRAGKAAQFAVLRQWLTGDLPPGTQAAAARELGMTEGALKAAVHRLRQRFRTLVKAQIQETVSSEEELRDELRYLIEVIGSS
jgi:RNA polymerase sigma-70 factor (ECF subfamily)